MTRVSIVLAACVLGCGARSGLEAPRESTDAGALIDTDVLRDAGAHDAAPLPELDAGREECGELGHWVEVSSPTTVDLVAVHVVASDDAWTVGHGGTMLHWDGAAWSRIESPTTENLSGVWFSDAEYGWIASRYGALRWDGARWTIVARGLVGVSEALNIVAGRARDDVWFGGGSVSPAVGLLFQWGGTAITRHASPTEMQVTSLRASEDGSALWALSALGRMARRETGGAWERIEEPRGEVSTALWSPTVREAWAAASHGHVHHYLDGHWASERIAGDDASFYAAWGSSARDVWVMGAHGMTAHYDGRAWEVMPAPTDAAIFALDGTCATDGWAVGAGGTILRLAR